MTRLADTRGRQAPHRSQTGLSRMLVHTFREAHSELLSTLYFILGNYEDAQDAYQEAFLKCWRTRSKLMTVRNLRAWIFRVGLNAAKDMQRNAWRRRAKPLLGLQSNGAQIGIAPAEALIDREALERIRTALLDLRPEEKEVFLLRQNGSLTYDEIAALRHRPVGTVKTQMRSALHKLRQVLQERPDG